LIPSSASRAVEEEVKLTTVYWVSTYSVKPERREEFLAAMKKQEAFARIPVIIVSTEGKEADTKRGMELGASAYLVKPFQASDLYALLERVMSLHG